MYNKEYPGFLNGLGSNDGGPSPFQSTLFVCLFLYQNLSSSQAIVYLYIYIYSSAYEVAMRTTLAVVEAQNAPAWQNITVVKSWASFLGHSS